jgi:hypothetical protein
MDLLGIYPLLQFTLTLHFRGLTLFFELLLATGALLL